MNNNLFFVVTDEDGTLRPLAGIWRADDAGERSAESYLKKNKNENCTISLVELVPVNKKQ